MAPGHNSLVIIITGTSDELNFTSQYIVGSNDSSSTPKEDIKALLSWTIYLVNIASLTDSQHMEQVTGLVVNYGISNTIVLEIP